MNLPSTIFVLRWLINDTFRQARSNGVYWFMLGVSVICIFVCLSIGVSGNVPESEEGVTYLPKGDPRINKILPDDKSVVVVDGEITFAFGAIRAQATRPRDQEVRFIQWSLIGLVADTLGVLMALIWTAGFLPTFVNPSTAAVLLAKPIPRWTLLFGKFIGVLVFVAFQVTIFAVGTWFALGLRTGYWDAQYLLSLPLLLIHFSVFFSFSALLAVTTRSTVTCIFGTMLFWLICWAMNYGHHMVAKIGEEMSPVAYGLMEAGYWILPKPADFGVILIDTLQAGNVYAPPFDVTKLSWSPVLSILSSCLFGLIMLLFAAREWITTDY